MAFYETFNLTIDDEIVDPSSYAQGDIQTTYAGTATTITQTHIVDGYKILIEFDDDFGDNVDLYLEGSKVISSRAVIGKDHIAEAGDLSVESIVVNVGKDYEGGFKVVSYQGDTGETIGNVASLINDDNIRYCTLAGFCNTNVGAPNYASAGVIGVGYTETTSINPAIGVRGRGVSTNVQDCAGGIFDAETATGSNTYAVYAKASGGSVANYSFYGEAGEMYNLGNVNFAAVCAADTFRLASGKYIGYSAAVGTAPTGGLSFNTSNTASFTSAIVCQSNAQITRTAGDANVTLRRVNTGATAIANGNIFATIRGQGYDGSAYVTSCEMYMDATQDHSSGKSGGRIVFQTTTNDTATATKRWVIENDGHFTPFADNTYDYGTTTLQGRDGFFAGNVNVGTLRLASGKYIGYSAAVGTAPTGGLRFNTSNNAIFTGTIDSGAITSTSTVRAQASMSVFGTGGSAYHYMYRQNAGGTAVTSGQPINTIYAFPHNGTTYHTAGYVRFVASETQTLTAAGSRFEIVTTSNGSTTNTIRFYIDQDGHIKPNSNNAYDLATSALKIRQAHVTDYYNYKTVDNEAISHLIYESGTDSIMRRMTLANAETKLRAQMFTALNGASYSNFYLRSNGTGFEFANPIASINMQANLYDLTETIVNNVGGDQVRLDVAINSSQTSFDIEKTSGVVWAGDGAEAGDYLLIDNEIILVNSADAPDSGTGKQTLTSVSRAQKGTTAAIHLDEASVKTITYSYSTSIQPVSVATGQFESGDKVRQVDLSPSINFVFDKSSNVTVVSASVITVSDTNKWFIIGY